MKQEPVYIKINEYGTKYYYSDREMKVRHRADGPAVEWPDGTKEWWQNGQLHRSNGPAVECYASGDKFWYIDGKHLTEAEFLAATAPKEVHELSLDDIADRLGLPVESLKIVK